MIGRFFGLAIITFLSGCSSISDNPTDISSLDSVKKHLSGTWLQSDERTTNKFEFIKDFQGYREYGIKRGEDNILIETNPDYFELFTESDTVRIRLVSMGGETSVTIKYLSQRKLIVDKTEYQKINYR